MFIYFLQAQKHVFISMVSSLTYLCHTVERKMLAASCISWHQVLTKLLIFLWENHFQINSMYLKSCKYQESKQPILKYLYGDQGRNFKVGNTVSWREERSMGNLLFELRFLILVVVVPYQECQVKLTPAVPQHRPEKYSMIV